MDTELVELVGKLHFRTSYGQNALTHSIEVAELLPYSIIFCFKSLLVLS